MVPGEIAFSTREECLCTICFVSSLRDSTHFSSYLAQHLNFLKYMVSCFYSYTIAWKSLTTLKKLPVLLLISTSFLLIPQSCHCYSLAFLRMCCNRNHREYSIFRCRNTHLRFLHVFSWLIAHLFLSQNIIYCMGVSVCLSIHLFKDIIVVSCFWLLWMRCYKYSLVGFSVNFQINWVNAWKPVC